MRKGLLITIGTEITSGEVINSNAAWVSLRLEERGLRVFAHLTVRDQRDEILKALRSSSDYDLIVVTGGLGPTSDDITRACMADYAGLSLDFADDVWQEMKRVYQARGLPLREAHRHQCHFPQGAERLLNPVGTALGFHMQMAGRSYFVLPGPPRELEGMWKQEVEPRLERLIPPSTFHWRRWTCLGAPESEIAELVEACVAGHDLEVGYRAAVPYVKVKLYTDDLSADHRRVTTTVAAALAPFVVAEGFTDLAEELLRLWPLDVLRVSDCVCGVHLAQRLFKARRERPRLDVHLNDEPISIGDGLTVRASGDEFTVDVRVGDLAVCETLRLPFQLSLASERGRLSAAEWALWTAVKALSQ